MITVKFQIIRHKTALAKIQKDDEAEETAKIEIEDAIASIEIDLDSLKVNKGKTEVQST